MTELQLIEPTQLYNTINQFLYRAFISNPQYLSLFDVRRKDDYDESHIITAKRLKRDEKCNFILPKNVELECCWNVIVYDGNSDEIVTQNDAVKAGKLLFSNGTRKTVKILKGGYEKFSELYPFFRTQKKLYLPRELERFQTYPLEAIQDFLYLASRETASNRRMHREMNITAHVNCDINFDPIYDDCPGGENLSYSMLDSEDPIKAMHDVCDFLQKKRFEGSRVLVISKYAISRNVTVAIGYLIKYAGMRLRDAWMHLKEICLPMQPSWTYMKELARFEADCRGTTDIHELTEEEFYGKRLRGFRIESQTKSALPCTQTMDPIQ